MPLLPLYSNSSNSSGTAPPSQFTASTSAFTSVLPNFQLGHWQAAQEQQALDLLMRRRVDALIVLGGVIEDAAQQKVAERVPLVAVGRDAGGLSERCVLIDNHSGIREVVRHLAELGHRDVAFIAGLESQHDAAERREGFEEVMREYGLDLRPGLMLMGDYTEASGERATKELLRSGEPFTALVCANDQMALGARLALYRRGVRVPEDVSLTGFDDLFSSRYTTPPLTTVHQAVNRPPAKVMARRQWSSCTLPQ